MVCPEQEYVGVQATVRVPAGVVPEAVHSELTPPALAGAGVIGSIGSAIPGCCPRYSGEKGPMLSIEKPVALEEEYDSVEVPPFVIVVGEATRCKKGWR